MRNKFVRVVFTKTITEEIIREEFAEIDLEVPGEATNEQILQWVANDDFAPHADDLEWEEYDRSTGDVEESEIATEIEDTKGPEGYFVSLGWDESGDLTTLAADETEAEAQESEAVR